jgi:hypothetical protein
MEFQWMITLITRELKNSTLKRRKLTNLRARIRQCSAQGE